MTRTPELTGYQRLGPREYLDRLLAEYQLSDADVAGAVRVQTPPGAGGKPGPAEYLIHESLLRPHDPFPCAGDSEAREFCQSIASEMVLTAGISLQQAVALINRHWSDPAPGTPGPRRWIVGLDVAYHEDAGFWAREILTQRGDEPGSCTSRRRGGPALAEAGQALGEDLGVLPRTAALQRDQEPDLGPARSYGAAERALRRDTVQKAPRRSEGRHR